MRASAYPGGSTTPYHGYSRVPHRADPFWAGAVGDLNAGRRGTIAPPRPLTTPPRAATTYGPTVGRMPPDSSLVS